MRKIGITGASGHIGGVLCKLLINRGYKIGLFVFKEKVALNVPQHLGDITDKTAVNDFIKQYDKIIHLAADISVDGNSSEKMYNTNVMGTKNVVEACLENNIERLVHFSSIAAIEQLPLNQPINEQKKLVTAASFATAYGKSKADSEREVMKGIESGLNAVIVAPTTVMGPMDFRPSVLGQSLLDMYNNKIPAVVKGGQDWVDVRDIAEGALLALEKGESGEKYLLGSEFFSIQEISEMIGEIYQCKTPTTVLPFWVARLGVPFESIKSKLSGKLNGFTQESLTALKYSNPSVSHLKATQILGYNPRPVKQSLKETLDWLIEHDRIN